MEWGLTVFGAGSEQVDNVEVRTQVTHDLQLRHQSLSLTPPRRGWRETVSERTRQQAVCLPDAWMESQQAKLLQISVRVCVSVTFCVLHFSIFTATLVLE